MYKSVAMERGELGRVNEQAWRVRSIRRNIICRLWGGERLKNFEVIYQQRQRGVCGRVACAE